MIWNWRNLALFCISDSKVVHWQQDYIHNFIISIKYLIRVSFSQNIRKRDHENLGNLLPPVPSYPPTLPQLSSRTSRVTRKNLSLYPLINSCFYIFLWSWELSISWKLNVPGSLAFPIVLTTKKTLIVIKTIVKARDRGDEIENEVTNSELWIRKPFFLQPSCKVASFPLVLNLMYE